MTDGTIYQGLRPGDLPSPPEAAIQIVHACAREDIDNVELSRLAGNDPVLTAELLRVANSPYFGAGREVRSLNRAIIVLGHRTLKNLALCLAVRDALGGDVPGVDTDAFWEDALLRATGARLLGKAAHLDAEECFTAGVLQDFGLLVMFHLDPARAPLWQHWRDEDPEARREAEAAHFGVTHDAVVRLLGESWRLPAALTAALGGHHPDAAGEDSAPPAPLARVLNAADWMAAVYRARDKGKAMRRYREIAEHTFTLREAKARDLLAELPAQVDLAGAALGLRISGTLDFEQVLREAELAAGGGDTGC